MKKTYQTTNGYKVTRLENYGYMISKKDEIIEIHPFSMLKVLNPKNLFYGGPLNLQGDFEIRELVNHPDSYGIDSNRIKKYQSWVNFDGTCGMMAAAVMLAYYQDYIDETIIPPTIRKKGSHSPEQLYERLMKDITSFSPVGTIAYDVSMGINRFLRRQKTNHNFKAKGSLTPTFGIVKTRLQQPIPKPTIVGLNRYLNAPKNYGNHWVLAYRIVEINNQKFYQIHDNHGRYKAMINVKWTIGVVRLLRK